ncbi:MAG: signal recognition particle-docking protein FtsY [Clostridiales bacterium]|nr:signal recognition particle-docking protein FtsY [Clostridiales bacterium]
MGLFKKIGDALKKTREALARKFDSLFSHGELTDDFFEDLTDILVSSDVGFEASEKIVDELRIYARKNKIRKADDVKQALKTIIKEMLDELESTKFNYPAVITIIGVNGVGKTTSIGKLTNYFKKNKKEVTLVAGDTFRAAASAQLTEWANRNKVRIVKHSEGADAAAVVYDGISSAKAKNTDVLIIDTAGRLHTKVNLMEELRKIDKIITREYENANRYNLIVLDATTGQNALSQIEHFNEYMHIDGIILTKLDGTAKGGVVITIADKLNLPVVFVGTGETIDDLEEFNSQEFVNNLF